MPGGKRSRRGARPPSVKRLVGLVWLAAVASGRAPDTASEEVRRFFRDFYQIDLTNAQLQTLLAS
jgi:hypothetical protein